MIDTCHFLRWKGYHPDVDAEGLAQVFLQNRVPYSCLRTCQPWGEDGDPATPESCTPERVCFEMRGTVLARLRAAREAASRPRPRGGETDP